MGKNDRTRIVITEFLKTVRKTEMDRKAATILLKGGSEWNEWREGRRTFFLNLAGENLRGLSLQGAYLVGTNLRKAKLAGSDRVWLSFWTFRQ